MNGDINSPTTPSRTGDLLVATPHGTCARNYVNETFEFFQEYKHIEFGFWPIPWILRLIRAILYSPVCIYKLDNMADTKLTPGRGSI